MKSINPTFEDEEFEKLKEKKEEKGLSWRDFILLLLEVDNGNIKPN